MLQRAWKQHQAGQLQAAEDAYLQLLVASPGDPDTNNLIGLLFIQTGRPAIAEVHIRKALEAEAGHRLSTGGIEEVIASHPDVAECAVFGAADTLKGEVPVGLVVLKAGVSLEDSEIIAEVIQLVRDKIGPVAAFKSAAVAKRLPKTRSGKILRGTMKKIADGAAYTVPGTIN